MDQQVRGSEGLGLCGSEGAHLFHEERGSELVTFTLDVFRPSSIDRAPARAAFPAENNPIGFQIESTHRDRTDRGLVADPEWGILPSSGAANGSVNYYLDYLAACRNLARQHGKPLRRLDRALLQWSKERSAAKSCSKRMSIV